MIWTGNYHLNTLEFPWHKIKIIKNNFSELSVEKLKIMYNKCEGYYKIFRMMNKLCIDN